MEFFFYFFFFFGGGVMPSGPQALVCLFWASVYNFHRNGFISLEGAFKPTTKYLKTLQGWDRRIGGR